MTEYNAKLRRAFLSLLCMGGVLWFCILIWI